jgi:16S rRNA processing protein RimM
VKKFFHEQRFIDVGFIRKSYGYKGDVKLEIEDIYLDDVLETRFLLVGIDGLKVPFRIESLETDKDWIAKFHGVDDPSDTEKIVGKALFLTEKDIKHAKKYIDEDEDKNEWVQYSIKDLESGQVHQIIEIREFPQQLMAVIEKEGKEALIPLSDQLIDHIDDQEKLIVMNLPEGLLDL